MGSKVVKQQLLSAEVNPHIHFLMGSNTHPEPLTLAKSLSSQVPSFVTKKEFVTLLAKFGRKQAVLVADMFMSKGKEETGFVSMYEFLSAMLLLSEAQYTDKLRGLFALYDFDKEGELNQENFEILAHTVLNVIQKITGLLILTEDQLAQMVSQTFSDRDAFLFDEFVSLVKTSAAFSFLRRVQQASAPVLHPALYAFDPTQPQPQTQPLPHKQQEPSQFKLPRLESSFADYRTRSKVSKQNLIRGRHTSLAKKDIIKIVRSKQNGQIIKPQHIKRLKLLYDLLAYHSVDCIRLNDLKDQKTFKFLKRIALGFKGALRKAPTFEKFLEEVFPNATILQVNVLAGWMRTTQDYSRVSERQALQRGEEEEKQFHIPMTVESHY